MTALRVLLILSVACSTGCMTMTLWERPAPTEIERALLETECTIVSDVRINQRAGYALLLSNHPTRWHGAIPFDWESGTLVEVGGDSPGDANVEARFSEAPLGFLGVEPIVLESVHLEVTRSEPEPGRVGGARLQGTLSLKGRMSELPRARVVADDESASVAADPFAISAEEVRKLVLDPPSSATEASVEATAAVDVGSPPRAEMIRARRQQGDYVYLRRDLLPYLRYVDIIQLPSGSAGRPGWQWSYNQTHGITFHAFDGYERDATQAAPACTVVYREVGLEVRDHSTRGKVWRSLLTPFTAAVDVAGAAALVSLIVWAEDAEDDF